MRLFEIDAHAYTPSGQDCIESWVRVRSRWYLRGDDLVTETIHFFKRKT